ncbi:MAG: hypothetical protein WC519_00095 [Parcubacteria group bacterium]
MKRILLSGGIILSVVGVVAGATYAAWTASTNIGGNTVSTAQLSITAAGSAGGSGITDPLPFSESGFIPGSVSDPQERAVITNNSGVPLDLYMYLDGSGDACYVTKLAWQSSVLNTGPVLYGYASSPTPAPSHPGKMDGSDTDSNFTVMYPNLWGVSNKVKIADAANFGPGTTIAMRQIIGLATDADNGYQGKACDWSVYFVGETVTP